MRGTSSQELHVGMVLFPRLTQLDLTAPYDVSRRMPQTTVHLMAATTAPVASQHGLAIPEPGVHSFLSARRAASSTGQISWGHAAMSHRRQVRSQVKRSGVNALSMAS